MAAFRSELILHTRIHYGYGSAHQVSHENNKYPDAGPGKERQLQEVGEYESLGATDRRPHRH